jgi:hypothetical protein
MTALCKDHLLDHAVITSGFLNSIFKHNCFQGTVLQNSCMYLPFSGKAGED